MVNERFLGKIEIGHTHCPHRITLFTLAALVRSRWCWTASSKIIMGRESQLAVGYGRGEISIGSDAIALAPVTLTATHLDKAGDVV